MLLSSPSRETLASDVIELREEEYLFPASLRPIEEILVVIDDEELEALAKVFAMSPVKRAMTFEVFLAVEGFARSIVTQAPPRS